MAELTPAGYTQLRTGSPVSEWFIELRDDNNQPIPIFPGPVNRLSGADSRVTVSDDTGSQTITISVQLDSDDVGATPGNPVTVEASVLYAAVSGGNPLTSVEGFDPFTWSAPGDEGTINHHVEVPEQA